jgi:hypothetical protein
LVYVEITYGQVIMEVIDGWGSNSYRWGVLIPLDLSDSSPNSTE